MDSGDMTGGEAPAGAPSAFLQVRNVHKRFAGVHALRGVDFTIEAGRIYHLLGENGCGKSTLIKIIAGAQPPDEGSLLVNGVPRREHSPIEALRAGIETVYQDFSLLPNLSVAENIGLSAQLMQQGGRLARPLDASALRRTATRGLSGIGLPTTDDFLRTRVDQLPIAARQMVAIARAVATDARLVIMDEPTTSLTRREVGHLIGVVVELRRAGVSVLFVSHKLDECFEIGGQVAIFRDGRNVQEGPIESYTKDELAFWMTGRSVHQTRVNRPAARGPALLRVQGLERQARFRSVDFELAAGEVLGITGLLDSGRNELARALAGIEPAECGAIHLDGQALHLAKPADAIRAGIGYVPEDRLGEGLFLDKPIADNIVLPVLHKLRSRMGIIDDRRCLGLAQQTSSDLRVAAPDLSLPIKSLSGGNQQRVLIGRWLTINPKVLVLHGPTVGVDVGSKETIFRIIHELSARGLGVLIVSDDLPELLHNCDRILVMRKGRITRDCSAASSSEEAIYAEMMAEEPLEEHA